MAGDIKAARKILAFHPNGDIAILAHFRINVSTHFVADIVCREIKDPDPELRVEFAFHASDIVTAVIVTEGTI